MIFQIIGAWSYFLHLCEEGIYVSSTFCKPDLAIPTGTRTCFHPLHAGKSSVVKMCLRSPLCPRFTADQLSNLYMFSLHSSLAICCQAITEIQCYWTCYIASVLSGSHSWWRLHPQGLQLWCINARLQEALSPPLDWIVPAVNITSKPAQWEVFSFHVCTCSSHVFTSC